MTNTAHKRLLSAMLMSLTMLLTAAFASPAVSAAEAVQTVTVPSSGSMYVIGGTASPQYASSYEDMYDVLVPRMLEDFESSNIASSPDSTLTLSDISHTGKSGLLVTPHERYSSILNIPLMSYDLSGTKFIMFAVRTGEGGAHLTLTLTSMAEPSKDGAQVREFTASADVSGEGWQTVICDVSRFTGLSSPDTLEISCESTGYGRSLMPWYIDSFGFSDNAGAAKMLKYLSADYYAGNHS